MTGPALPPTGERLHAFDAARAVAMFGGLLLHGAIGYIENRPPQWPLADPSQSPFFDVIVYVIHAHRMQAFFLIAGFFGAMMIATKGPGAFVRNRLVRIGIPTVGGLLLIGPLTMFTILFALQQSGRADPDASTWRLFLGYYISRTPGQWFDPIHLWFLVYLGCMYPIALAGHHLAARCPASLRARAHRYRDFLTTSSYALVPLALATLPFVAVMHEWTIDTPRHIFPTPHIWAYYALFFTYGVVLWGNKQAAMDHLAARWGRHLTIGACCLVIILFGCYPWLKNHTPDAPAWPLVDALARTLLSVAAWALSFALLGVFLKYRTTPSHAWRYAADASYWFYLMHLPVVFAIGGLLLPVPISCAWKLPLLLAGTAAVLLPTYHVMVRHTLIGRILNGPRRLAGVARPTVSRGSDGAH
ncbi:MAG: acyltransferase family protein [Planctomycetota bacterium]|nr:acyltransferase family protein [Planctomycetota bacterium]